MKRLMPLVLIVIIAGLLVVIGLLLGGKRLGPGLPGVTDKTEISAHTVVKEVLPIGEYASLAYHYTSVVKDVNTRDIRGWNIPFTTKKYLFTYDGIMKLGIDGSLIRVEEKPPAAGADTAQSGVETVRTEQNESPDRREIFIILPPIKILSHEVAGDSIEVFEQSQTIFNEIKIEEAFKVTADRKREMEEKVMASSAVNEARVSAEQQFGALLGRLPGIGDYKVIFVWQEAEPLPAR